jgi:ferredoxin
MNVERAFEKCSRCGLCLSVCPTYSMTMREQYSPRGRLTLMRMVEEGGDIASASPYVSSCLRCALCEEVCPTGVPFRSLAQRFINHALSCDEAAQIERLREAAEFGGGDPARAVVFDLMINAWRADGVSVAMASEAPSATGTHAAGAIGLKPTLLIAGAILSQRFAHIVNKATQALETSGHVVVRSAAVDALSLPWLENGLLPVFDRLATKVRADIESLGVFSVVTLEPALMDIFAGALVAPLIARWRCGERQNSPQSVFELPGVEPLDLGTLVAALPPDVAIDRTLHGADALHRAAIERRGAPSVVATPAGLRGAGAPPVIDCGATRFLEQLIAAKSAWARRLPAGLATIDSYTLLRVPAASHVLQDRRS